MVTDDPHPNQSTRAELLKEYELCQANARGLDAQIWQTAGVLGFLAIGGLGAVAGQSLSVPVVIIIGLLVSTMSHLWLRMARRWWSVQHAFFMRMRHIEATLGLYQVRYVGFLDNIDGLDATPLSETFKAEIRARSHKRDDGGKAHEKEGVRRTLEKLPCLDSAAWFLYGLWRIIACAVGWQP